MLEPVRPNTGYILTINFGESQMIIDLLLNTKLMPISGCLGVALLITAKFLFVEGHMPSKSSGIVARRGSRRTPGCHPDY